MTAPSDTVIRRAELAAAKSPCAKSKRGVVLTFDEHVVAEGFNGPPPGIGCDGSTACRNDCGKRCVHAEMRALRGAATWLGQFPHSHARDGGRGLLDVVHVKLGEDGRVVAGGGPSCWQCSREILDVGFVRGVWLYEAGPSKCLSCRRFEDSSAKLEERLRRCPECRSELTRADAWRYYTADEFHQVTCRAARVA